MKVYLFAAWLLVSVSSGLNAQNKATVHVFAGVSGATNKTKSFGFGGLGFMKFGTHDNIGITAGAALELSQLPRLSLRVAVNYQPYEFSAKGRDKPLYYDTLYYNFKGYQFTPSLCLLYHFIQTGNWQVYAGAGAGLNLATYTDQQMTYFLQNFVIPVKINKEFKRAWFSEEIRGGIRYKQIDLNFCWTRGRILRNEEGIIQRTSFGANLNYFIKL